MKLESQLYLLQLEEYELDRFDKWLKDNPGKTVVEKKGKLKWTFKIKCLYLLARLTGSLHFAVFIYKPVDFLVKILVVWFAGLKLNLFHKKLVVVGITGSWGKTTTKEQVVIVLNQKYKVFKTVGNHNTLLGVAMDILKMPTSSEIFVCEMGAYQRGDIKKICDLVHPKVGIVTAIGPMHLERFGSLEEIRKTKMEILDAVKVKIGPDQDWQTSICDYFNVPHVNSFPQTSHRLEIIESNGLIIIDDSYNSNPAGFQRALSKLKTYGKPRILVTPGMIEMGELQFEENKKAAVLSAKICDHVIFVGQTNLGAWKKGNPKATFVSDIEEAKIELSKISKPGATILFENDLPDHYL